MPLTVRLTQGLTHPQVLSNVSKSLAHLLENDTDRQHNVAVTLQVGASLLVGQRTSSQRRADDKDPLHVHRPWSRHS